MRAFFFHTQKRPDEVLRAKIDEAVYYSHMGSTKALPLPFLTGLHNMRRLQGLCFSFPGYSWRILVAPFRATDLTFKIRPGAATVFRTRQHAFQI